MEDRSDREKWRVYSYYQEIMIYLDNAATSFPKPREVLEAISRFLNEIGATPGRSGHRLSIEAGRLLYNTRENLSKLFNVSDPLRIILLPNATEALNLAIYGYLRPKDHVITSSIEHNSVMRPLREMEKHGVELTVIQCSQEGFINPEDIERSISSNTKMIILNHASNVMGSIQPIREVGTIARNHDILFLVDAAQTAGCYLIDVEKDQIDLLAFTGHKSLFGTQGTGGFFIGERVDIERLNPLKTGGTGSKSEHETQPDFLPDRYESGTLNMVGFAGLNAGVQFILDQGIEKIRKHKIKLTERLIDGLKKIPHVIIYGGLDPYKQTATVSFNIINIFPSEAGLILDEKYNIMTRTGLHCAPCAHRTIGTFPAGTLRFAIGYFNTIEEIDVTVSAVEEIVKKS